MGATKKKEHNLKIQQDERSLSKDEAPKTLTLAKARSVLLIEGL